MRKRVIAIMFGVLGGVFIISSILLLHSMYMVKKDEDLNRKIQKMENTNQSTPVEQGSDEIVESSSPVTYGKYHAIYQINHDFVGWIRIQGTNISYPVMQSMDRPNFYLRRNFNKESSVSGVPYIDEASDLEQSNNIIIYGHNMHNGTMFADLLKYGEESFYNEHKVIEFNTLLKDKTYEVIAVFKIDVDKDDFKYTKYTNMNKEQFDDYVANIKKRSLYSLKETAKFGDELITLSTCEYTYKNGRFVVVAKKVCRK